MFRPSISPCAGLVEVQRLVALAMLMAACPVPNPAYQGREEPADAAARTGDARPDGPLGAPPDGPPDAPADQNANERPSADVAVAADTRQPLLLAAWHLDDGAGSPTAGDSSGNGFTGMLVNMDPAKVWVADRKSGTALEFAPTDTNPDPGVMIALTPTLTGLQQFTIAAWIYRTGLTVPQQMTVISQQLNDTIYETFSLSFVDNRLNMLLPGGSAELTPYLARADDVTLVGVWTHVAATFDGRDGRLYRNGLLLKAFPYVHALPVSNKPIFIGTNINVNYQQPFVGYIDDVVIYDGAISEAAIADLARP